MAEELRWPWGKHAGELVSDLPSDYIVWALENLEQPPHAEELQNQLDLRAGKGVTRRRGEDR